MTTIPESPPKRAPETLALPRGFRAAGVHCGLKRRRPDLALLVSDVPAAAAGLFTRNPVRAACVDQCAAKLESGWAQAVVVASGNANACTGRRGVEDARTMTRAIAAELGLDDAAVLGASTGVIGRPLPVERIVAAAPTLVTALGSDAMPAALAMLTTDAFPKTATAELELDGGVVTIVGLAKGAGMIHPDMATMIAVLATDALVPPPLLRQALRDAVDGTFNCISVDGDTSTNDSVFLLANGASGCRELTGAGDPSYDRFVRSLTRVAEKLATAIVADGEGARHLVEVVIERAASDADARRAAEAVMTSVLVKTALYGEELNWGRIAAAVGRSGAAVRPDLLSIAVGGVSIVEGGVGVPQHYPLAQPLLQRHDVTLTIGLGLGAGRFRGWTSDLGVDYVKFNSGYLT